MTAITATEPKFDVALQHRSITARTCLDLGRIVIHHRRPQESFDLDAIAALVAPVFGVSSYSIYSRCRTEPVSLARMVTMLLAYETCAISQPKIGNQLGRVASTVTHDLQRIRDLMETDKKLRDIVERIRQQIGVSNDAETHQTR